MNEADQINRHGEMPQTDAECRVALRMMLEEMKRANARMDQNQIEITRLGAETRAMLDKLPRLLAR